MSDKKEDCTTEGKACNPCKPCCESGKYPIAEMQKRPYCYYDCEGCLSRGWQLSVPDDCEPNNPKKITLVYTAGCGTPLGDDEHTAREGNCKGIVEVLGSMCGSGSDSSDCPPDTELPCGNPTTTGELSEGDLVVTGYDDAGCPIWKSVGAPAEDQNTVCTYQIINGMDGDGDIVIEIECSDGNTSTLTIPEPSPAETDGVHFSGQPTLDAGTGILTFPQVNDGDESNAAPLLLDLSSLMSTAHPTIIGANDALVTFDAANNVWTVDVTDTDTDTDTFGTVSQVTNADGSTTTTHTAPDGSTVSWTSGGGGGGTDTDVSAISLTASTTSNTSIVVSVTENGTTLSDEVDLCPIVENCCSLEDPLGDPLYGAFIAGGSGCIHVDLPGGVRWLRMDGQPDAINPGLLNGYVGMTVTNNTSCPKSYLIDLHTSVNRTEEQGADFAFGGLPNTRAMHQSRLGTAGDVMLDEQYLHNQSTVPNLWIIERDVDESFSGYTETGGPWNTGQAGDSFNGVVTNTHNQIIITLSPGQSQDVVGKIHLYYEVPNDPEDSDLNNPERIHWSASMAAREMD